MLAPSLAPGLLGISIRGYVVAVVPLAIVLAVQLSRAILVLPDFPGWEPSVTHPYFIP